MVFLRLLNAQSPEPEHRAGLCEGTIAMPDIPAGQGKNGTETAPRQALLPDGNSARLFSIGLVPFRVRLLLTVVNKSYGVAVHFSLSAFCFAFRIGLSR